MVLEETLIICGSIDLPEITRAFREAGVQVRITQNVALESLVSAKGTIRDIMTLLKEEAGRTEDLIDEIDTEIDEGEDDELGEPRDPYLDAVERINEAIVDFMKKYQPGDVIPLDDIKEWISPFSGIAPDEEMTDDLLLDIESTMMYRYMALIALDENGLTSADDEKVIVQSHMEPEDIVLSLPASTIEDIDPGLLKDYGVQAEMIIIAVPEHRLDFGPESVAEMNLDAVDDIIEDLGLDEDVYALFRESVSLKQVVIARTMEILEERGALTLAEITEELGSSAMGGSEEGWSIVLDLTPEFVKRLLNDLKKIGMVRKRGSGFRVV